MGRAQGEGGVRSSFLGRFGPVCPKLAHKVMTVAIGFGPVGPVGPVFLLNPAYGRFSEGEGGSMLSSASNNCFFRNWPNWPNWPKRRRLAGFFMVQFLGNRPNRPTVSSWVTWTTAGSRHKGKWRGFRPVLPLLPPSRSAVVELGWSGERGRLVAVQAGLARGTLPPFSALTTPAHEFHIVSVRSLPRAPRALAPSF